MDISYTSQNIIREVIFIQEQGDTQQKINDNFEFNPYLDTSENPSLKASYGGGGPYLITNRNSSIKANDEDGSPYLDTSEGTLTQS